MRRVYFFAFPQCAEKGQREKEGGSRTVNVCFFHQKKPVILSILQKARSYARRFGAE